MTNILFCMSLIIYLLVKRRKIKQESKWFIGKKRIKVRQKNTQRCVWVGGNWLEKVIIVITTIYR